jgi:hypothetical protein
VSCNFTKLLEKLKICKLIKETIQQVVQNERGEFVVKKKRSIYAVPGQRWSSQLVQLVVHGPAREPRMQLPRVAHQPQPSRAMHWLHPMAAIHKSPKVMNRHKKVAIQVEKIIHARAIKLFQIFFFGNDENNRLIPEAPRKCVI